MPPFSTRNCKILISPTKAASWIQEKPTLSFWLIKLAISRLFSLLNYRVSNIYTGYIFTLYSNNSKTRKKIAFETGGSKATIKIRQIYLKLIVSEKYFYFSWFEKVPGFLTLSVSFQLFMEKYFVKIWPTAQLLWNGTLVKKMSPLI